MKKIILLVNLSFVIGFLYPKQVLANIVCNDGTVSPSCQDCHRGCCSKHGGCSSSSSSSSGSSNNSSSSSNNSNSSNNNSGTIKEQPVVSQTVKSSDTTLKKVIVDNENISIANAMSYSTTKQSVDLLVEPNDDGAIVDYLSKVNLDVGENNINILVTASNGNTKKYTLNIIREKILSNNKNIKIFVDEKEITFNSYKSEKIILDNDKRSLNITYELEDSFASVEIIGNDNLEVGYNEVVVKVIAENKEEQEYIILVEKEDKKITQQEQAVETQLKVDDKANLSIGTFDAPIEDETDILSTGLSLGFYGGLGYLIYKKIKNKR